MILRSLEKESSRVNNLSCQVNRVSDHRTPNGMMLVMAIL